MAFGPETAKYRKESHLCSHYHETVLKLDYKNKSISVPKFQINKIR